MPDTAAYADKQERMQAKKKKPHSEQIQSGKMEVNERMMTNAFTLRPWCGRKEEVVKHQKALQIVKIHRSPWLINIHQKHHLSLKF